MAVDTSISVDSIAPVDTFDGPLAASDRWRSFVARNPFAAATIAGLIATQMATLVGYYFIGIGLPQTPWPLFNGILVAPADRVRLGVVLLRRAVDPHGRRRRVHASSTRCSSMGASRLPRTVGGDISKGIIYGLILGLISMGFLVPYVYAPKQGFGFFSFYTPNTWKLPLSIALWHLTYGFLVGTLYSPIRARQSRVS